MRLELLKIYLCILESGSLAGAARRLHLTQPTVSMSLASIEETLGQRLIVRTKGQRQGLETTPAGAVFAAFARKALEDYRLMRAEIASEQLHYEPFCVATTPSPGSVITPILTNSFRKAYPNVPFVVESSTGGTIFNKLRKGESQIAITGTRPTEKNLVFEPFFYDPLELICHSSLEVKSPITLRKLKSMPLIIRPDTSNVMQLLISALKKANVRISEMNVVMQLYGNSDVLQAVSLGSGVGFVTRSVLSSNQYSSIKVLPVKHFQVTRYIYIVRKKETPFRDSVRLFWDYAMSAQWRENNYFYNTMVS